MGRVADHIYTLRCGQPVKHQPGGRCIASLVVQAGTEREARLRIIEAGQILGWRLGVRHHARCPSHLVGGGWNGTWVEL